MKKIVSLLLVALMLVTCFSLVACGDSEPKVKIIEVQLTQEEYAFVIKEGNTALKNDMNAFLAEIKESGEFQDIVDKYFKGEGEKVGYTVAGSGTSNTEGKFVVVTNCPFEPFEYLGTDGKIYGVDIEIAAAYAKSRNLELVIKNLPEFDSIFSEVDAGYADIGMAGITVSADREAVYDFTSTYYNASQKIIVAADNTAFDNCKTAADVEKVIEGLSKNTKFGYQNGTTGGMYVEGNEDWGYSGFANLDGKGYATALDAVNDLVNGNLYAVVVDEAPGNAIVKAINGD
ncbi:MAG: transporter substrate-binding domain-containing protein [Clostridia bacterium]|nr:transporter substrate-binding domain-containing protein [Clostridia bacterium]